MPRIAILVPAPDYAERWQPHAAQLTALIERETGAAVTLHNWRDDPAALAGYDLVLPLFAWGYQYDPARWFALLDGFEAQGLPVHNPPRLMRWNSDKIYLQELEAAGVVALSIEDTDLPQPHGTGGKARLLSIEEGTGKMRAAVAASLTEVQETKTASMAALFLMASIPASIDFGVMRATMPSFSSLKEPKTGTSKPRARM